LIFFQIKDVKRYTRITVTTLDKLILPTHEVLFDTMLFSGFRHFERLVWMQVDRHPCVLVVELTSMVCTI
jgi:hypothetical protein